MLGLCSHNDSKVGCFDEIQLQQKTTDGPPASNASLIEEKMNSEEPIAQTSKPGSTKSTKWNHYED